MVNRSILVIAGLGLAGFLAVKAFGAKKSLEFGDVSQSLVLAQSGQIIMRYSNNTDSKIEFKGNVVDADRNVIKSSKTVSLNRGETKDVEFNANVPNVEMTVTEIGTGNQIDTGIVVNI